MKEKSKHTGRPTTYTPQFISEIKVKLEKYLLTTNIPIIAEFCYKNHIPRTKIYELEGLKDTIKELIDKKEAQLEKLALNGEIDKTMAIFSLKQLGWTDKTEIEHSGGINLVINGITKV